jgi:hypothetical protein
LGSVERRANSSTHDKAIASSKVPEDTAVKFSNRIFKRSHGQQLHLESIAALRDIFTHPSISRERAQRTRYG